ncbi:hypothetical protein C791_5545 [Amycolatopsis azurea DSM 43854]|uniref:Uncharacterized protein n=1 Tax=Amycolatopsis azurea DSM 43854 TaxID=1238180 RepID=M2PXY4_9PSEU|nr:hypothetical protein C791_5545 [Amycolatopsis azurea DSM 43854]
MLARLSASGVAKATLGTSDVAKVAFATLSGETNLPERRRTPEPA